MKIPVFNKYFSINIVISLIIIEFLLLVPMILFLAISAYFLLFLSFLLYIYCAYIIHIYLVPLFVLLIPVEFYLRKKGRIIKYNIVNIQVKFQKYIYIVAALVYIAILIAGIILGQPMTEEELRYD